jgi:branched-chain amino acid transport system permease protein
MLKVLIISIIGGRGEIYGAVLGAYFVAALEKVLALLGDISTVVFPVVLIILLFTLPEGLYGLYRRHKYREYFPTIKIRNR